MRHVEYLTILIDYTMCFFFLLLCCFTYTWAHVNRNDYIILNVIISSEIPLKLYKIQEKKKIVLNYIWMFISFYFNDFMQLFFLR